MQYRQGSTAKSLSFSLANENWSENPAAPIPTIKYSFANPILDTPTLNKIQALQKRYQLKLKILLNEMTLDEVEQEFELLRAINKNKTLLKNLDADEKLIIEIYKFALIQATQNHIRTKYNIPAPEVEKPHKETSKFMWIVFGAFLVLELIPMVWGGFLGITELLTMLPLSAIAITVTSIVLCSIETLIIYSMMGPLLKEALGIKSAGSTNPSMEIYEKQIDALKDINNILTIDNKMKAAEYQQYIRLANVFNDHASDLKEYDIYLKKNFNELDPYNITGKGIIVIDNKIYFVEDKKLLKKSGENLTITLTDDEQRKLNKFECDAEDKIKLTKQNSGFLEQIISKANVVLTPTSETTVKKFEKSPIKKIIQGILSACTIALIVGNGYFFGVYMIANTPFTAGLIGTPLGWGIVGFLILGQLAMRLAIRSNVMFNMLNPTAVKHEEIREKINNYKINPKKYSEILTEKKRVEWLESELSKSKAALGKNISAADADPVVQEPGIDVPYAPPKSMALS